MDVITVKSKMENKIKQLNMARDELEKGGYDKAKTQALYDKKLAVTIMELRNGKECELDGVVTQNVPTTVIEKVAKGLCWEEQMEKDIKEMTYKNLLEQIKITTSQLNAYQSINRYLSEM